MVSLIKDGKSDPKMARACYTRFKGCNHTRKRTQRRSGLQIGSK